MGRNVLELKSGHAYSGSIDTIKRSLQENGYDFEPWFCDTILQEELLKNKAFWRFAKSRKGYVPVDKIVGCYHGHIEQGKTWLQAFHDLDDTIFLDQQEFRDFVASQETSEIGGSITLHQYGEQYYFISSGRHRILNSKFLHIPEIFCSEINEYTFNSEAFSLYSRIKALDPKAELKDGSIRQPVSASYHGVQLFVPLTDRAVSFMEESIDKAEKILSIPVYRRIYSWIHPVEKVYKDFISINLHREDDWNKLVPSLVYKELHTRKM